MRLIFMSTEKTDRLRADYKDAFDAWALQVSHLQAVMDSAPGGPVLSDAEERVATAETAYRDSRDRLTDEMMVDSGQSG